MNIANLDIAIVVVVMLSAAIGLVRGLIKEILSLLSWVVAFVAALYFSTEVAGYLPETWGTMTVRTAIAFVILFIGALIAASILQWTLSQLVATTGLSGTDRLLGFLFGAARGLLIAMVVLIGLREIAGDAQWWSDSVLQGELLAFEDDLRELFGKAREMVDEVPVPSGLE